VLVAAAIVASLTFTTLGAQATTSRAETVQGFVAAPTRAGDYIVRLATTDAAARAVAQAGGSVTKRLTLIGGVAAHLAPKAFAELARTSNITIVPDSVMSTQGSNTSSGGSTVDMGLLANIEQATAATTAWNGYNTTGLGVGVALVDTGIVPVPGLDRPGKIINAPDFSYEASNPALAGLDTAGHGTHLAGIIAGRDATADPKKPTVGFMGMAPNATLINVKVATADGTTSVSTVIQGLGWVVDNANSLAVPIRVVNLAFAADTGLPYQSDPLAYAVEQVWNAGIIVVASAGNAGAATSELANPAYDPFVIAVGATDARGTITLADDVMADYSQNGSATRGVDVSAPGTSVTSLRNPGSFIDWLYPEGVSNVRFFKGSGTSQASAVVSGAIALLVSKFPTATPDTIKYTLKAGSYPLNGVMSTRGGAGSLNIKWALDNTKVAANNPSRYAQPWEPSMGAPLSLVPGGGTGDPYAGSPWVARRWTSLGWTGDITDPDVWAARRWTGQTWDARRWTDNTWTSGTWASADWGGIRGGF
jgi:serine protease AprX